MHISWLGGSAVKLQTKHLDKDVTIVIDPIKPKEGNFPRSLTADIALYTHGEKNSLTISGSPFVLSTQGECEKQGVLFCARAGVEEGEQVFRIDAEGMSIGHLGKTKSDLTSNQEDLLSEVDILFIPVGGDGVYEPEKAAKIISILEPRVVIPMCYQSDTDPKAKPVSEFVKQVGLPPENEEKKVIIKSKDLPQENTKLIVVSKE